MATKTVQCLKIGKSNKNSIFAAVGSEDEEVVREKLNVKVLTLGAGSPLGDSIREGIAAVISEEADSVRESLTVAGEKLNLNLMDAVEVMKKALIESVDSAFVNAQKAQKAKSLGIITEDGPVQVDDDDDLNL